jgi:hypothetical protein
MTIQKNYFSKNAIILIFFILFLFSSNICRSESAAGESSPQPGGPSGPQADYQRYADLIAGVRSSHGAFASFERRPAWAEFAKFFDQSWNKHEKKQLAPMKEWAAHELADPISSGLSVFYPFSGPDFINPFTLFPNARTYILTALEPIGDIPRFETMTEKDFNLFFAELRQSLHDLLSFDYFISAHMHAAMESEELKGVLPIILFFMARERLRILDVDYWFMEPDGTIRKVPALDGHEPDSGAAIPGVRILFENPDSPGNRSRTLYYFRLNLYNGSFPKKVHFISFLKNLGPFITFMKSASYVMFDPRLGAARDFVLDQSRYVLQEDSGIPFRYFDPSVWALQFYGTYAKPISIFKEDYQADLAESYQAGRNIRRLPFGIGYHFRPGTANLLLASKK